MAKAYAEDLRRRGQASAGGAQRFAVRVSFVRDLARRVRESGMVRARPHTAGACPAKPTRSRPDLNPLEPAWSQRKRCLRQAAARTHAALAQARAEGLQTLSAQDAQSWFKHRGQVR